MLFCQNFYVEKKKTVAEKKIKDKQNKKHRNMKDSWT